MGHPVACESGKPAGRFFQRDAIVLVAMLLVLASGCATAVNCKPENARYTPRDCPPISDRAVITAKVFGCNSGAPRTQHPGLDLFVRDGAAFYVVRMHFGDLGDGQNSCLHFNECPCPQVLPGTYPVQTQRVKELFAYLKARQYTVGKFTSWGMPVLFAPAKGSNCGDAFVRVTERLQLPPSVLIDMRRWIRERRLGKWAFDRGSRAPRDEFFQGNGSAAPGKRTPGEVASDHASGSLQPALGF